MKLQNKQYEQEMFDRIAQEKDMPLSHEQLDFIVKGLSRSHVYLRGSMLDCGCGTANFGIALSKLYRGLDVTGIDISMETVFRCQAYGKNVLYGDVGDIGLFPRARFDAILCMCFLHHFPEPIFPLANISYWLKPGGILIIMDPDARNFIKQISRAGRLLFEKMGGTRYLLEHGMATPNETLHTREAYLECLPRYELLYERGYPEKQMFRKEDRIFILRKRIIDYKIGG